MVWGQSYAAVRKPTFFTIAVWLCLWCSCFLVSLNIGQYFALLGTFGTLAAFVYPVPDAYPFPHIAILSFIFGHLALLGNSLVYLLRQYNARLLDVKGIFLMTFALNALIFVVNLVTGGDYGFLTKPPLVGDHGLVANYLIVSLALSAAITLTKKILELFLEQEAEKMIAKKA